MPPSYPNPHPQTPQPPNPHSHPTPHPPSYRNTLALLGGAGVTAVAPDWPGHGDSAKPAPGQTFDYSERAYTAALDAFVGAVDLKKPLALVVQVGVCLGGGGGVLWGFEGGYGGEGG